MVCSRRNGRYFHIALLALSLSAVVDARPALAAVGDEVEVKAGEELILERDPHRAPRLWTLEDLKSEQLIRKRGKRRDTAAADAAFVAGRSRRAGKIRLKVSEVAALCLKHIARGFRHCEPNRAVSIEAVPNDEYYSVLYGMEKIDASDAWETSTGESSVIVAVVDTGVNYNHPDLSSNIALNTAEIPDNGIDDDGNGYIDDYYGYNAITGSGSGSDAGDPMDDNGHGTHVSGTIAAQGNNSIGVVGVAYGAKVLPVKALGSSGSGFISDIVDGMDYAVERGARAINLSLTSTGDSASLRSAIENARNNGVLVVAAAGNASTNIDVVPYYPAAYDYANLITVASTDSNDEPSYFTNFSATRVHVAAPGSSIASTSYTGGYVYMSGTSMATPHVAGVAALVFSVRPELSAAEVKQVLVGSVDVLSSLSGMVASSGRVNAARAIANALGEEFTEEEVAVTASSRRSGKTRVQVTGRAYAVVSEAGVSGATATISCRGRARGSSLTDTDGAFSIKVKRPRVGKKSLRCAAVVENASSSFFRIRAQK